MKIKSNCLLISEPFMEDSFFDKTVIWLFEHDKNGSAGFILNKPFLESSFTVMGDNDAEFPVLNGGPVNQNQLYFVHNNPNLNHSTPIGNNFYLSSNLETIAQFYIGNKSYKYFIFSGYCGWDPKQLNAEFKSKNWLVIDWFPEILTKNKKEMWTFAIESLGKEYAHYARAPKDASLN